MNEEQRLHFDTKVSGKLLKSGVVELSFKIRNCREKKVSRQPHTK